MKRLFQKLLISSLIFLAGCGLQPKPAKPKVDFSLPTVQTIRTISDITSVALEWTPLYSEKVEGYYLYRAQEGKKLQRIATIEDRYSSHYIDKDLQPDTLYVYAMSIFTKNGVESRPSKPVRVRTLPIPESVPFIDAIDHLPREIKIIWRPHPYQRVEWYIIERSEPRSDKWKEIATIKGRLKAEYIDKGLKDNKTYYYRIKVKTCDGIVSKPSKVVQASTKPRPKIVQGLQASQNLPRKIVLHWQPNSEPDIDHYNIYRSFFELGPYLKIAKAKKTEYTDLIKKDGAKYYYKVTAVDKDGLESFKQDVPVVGKTLSKPLPPVILNYKVEGKTFFVTWQSPDKRAESFIIKKVEKLGFMNSNEYVFKNIKSTSFSDAGLKPGAKYKYEVIAVDKYGIVSEPSKTIEFTIEK
ncbi:MULTISPECIES: fibronectin type III domain-containing protein [unclassified Nitratiruptor]|uniref:fibronectin type III domain-containing protein n=1 Tax=unclassified Nitratiruptor TaxID=2624044 RepID=UPI001916A318|nr:MULTISPECIES: fibronectin type III domain-containing protein [unclassified Nitratiruptor]